MLLNLAAFTFGNREEFRVSARRLKHQHMPQIGHNFVQKLPQVIPGAHQFINQCQHLFAVTSNQGINDLTNKLRSNQAERSQDIFFFNRGAGKGNHLVKRRLGIAHTATTG